MTWRVAKSLLHLRDQVNAKFPHRNRENDGTIGDEAHASRTSDHNPWFEDSHGVPVVSAMDITHDPAHGLDSYKMADELKTLGDPRIKYVISNHRIWNPSVSTMWRPYNGSNPHDHHVHISVKPIAALYDSEKDWNIPMLAGVTPGPKLPVTPETSVDLHEHILATEFGGAGDYNTSFYDNHVITDREMGVALPYKFKGVRPKVRVMGPHGTAVGAIVDVGPWNVNDPYWLVRGRRPQAESGTDTTGRHTNFAGIDLTPAMAKAVGISGKGRVNWEFVDPIAEPIHPVTPAAWVAVAAVVVPTAHRTVQRTVPVLPGSTLIANWLRSLFGRTP